MSMLEQQPIDAQQVEQILSRLIGVQQRATAELLAKFDPDELILHHVLEGSQYAGAVNLKLPKGLPIGGLYIENGTSGSKVAAYLGAENFGEPFFDVAPGNWKAYPTNQYDGYSVATIALDVATAGRVRIILANDKLGPGEGSIAGGSAAVPYQGIATTATRTSVASSAAAIDLLAANAARKGFAIFNESTAALSLIFGAGGGAADYTVQIAAGGYYEAMTTTYTGLLRGIWAAANGFARITELT